MTRTLRAALVAAAVLVLAAPAQAASPTATVKPPAAGDITLAHLVFSTKGSGTPKLVLTNRSKLSKQLTIAGGVKKLKKNSFLASIAVARRTAGSPSGATPAFKLATPKGTTFSKFTSKQVGKNLLSSSARPKWCSAVPPSFGYVARKLLAGSFAPRFPSAQEYVLIGYQLNCPGGYEERANFAAALRGEPDPGAGGGSGGGGDDGGPGGGDCDFNCEEDEDEGGGVETSPTLTGSGTVIAEGGDVFRYEISFNEPVYGYMLDGAGGVRCPSETYAAWYSECTALGNSNSVDAGGQTFRCSPGEYTFQFSCYTSGSSSGGVRTRPPSVPAGTPIVGRFKTHAGQAPTSRRVKLIGYGSGGQSQPAALSGP